MGANLQYVGTNYRMCGVNVHLITTDLRRAKDIMHLKFYYGALHFDYVDLEYL
jgi:hypothetical protein